ncbi:MAG TPA: hypothetical protein PLX23_11985 [Candidatus Hydrogenedens sp.]|nr:hypothetical protein [Candidatus Hydrogenedens sp.]
MKANKNKNNHNNTNNDTNKISISTPLAISIIIYTISVLIIDLLATFNIHFIFNWGIFNIDLSYILNKIPAFRNSLFSFLFIDFDLRKFFLWLIIPIIIFNKAVDFYWFSFKSWKKNDYFILLGVSILCVASLVFVILSPTLSSYYLGFKTLPFNQKVIIFFQQIFWIISWLLGWEFLNRHLLLRACLRLNKKYAWIFVPIVETVYHIHKAFLEMIGMSMFSIFACLWTIRKENNLLAFLCHLLIELGLVILLLNK